MEYINRDIEKLFKQVSSEYSCVLVIGPRQVGKTTLLKNIEPNRKIISLDDYEARNLAKTDPKYFLEVYTPPIIIDEVQYAPELFSYIKMQIDAGAKPSSFWLTGSQSFELMRLAKESMAGRVAILNLTSLSQNEFYDKSNQANFEIDLFKLKDRIKVKKAVNISEIFKRIFAGGMPGLLSGKFTNREIFYKSYIETYISRDIKDEVSLKDNFKFMEFITAVACRNSQELNIHSLAKDVDISDDTAKRWLFLLEKAEIIYYLHPYSNHLLKRMVKRRKVYFFDTGFVSYLTKHHTPEILQNSAINGAILENYVINEIRKSYLNLGIPFNVYYYRDKEQNEIDLILDYNGVLHPIEIKKTSSPNLRMLKSKEILKKANIPIGQWAIIFSSDNISALDKETLIIPIWCI